LQINKILAIIVTFAVLTGCQRSGKVLNLYNWTYYIPFETLKSFEAETGIRVKLDSYDSNEMMYAKIAAGNTGYDITLPSSYYVPMMIGKNMLHQLSHEQLPNLKGVSPDVLAMMDDFDKNSRFSIPYFVGAAGINVNTEFVKDYEESWHIFERPDLKNRISLLNDTRDMLGAALLTLGFSVNTINAAEVDAAKNLVLLWKKNALKFDAESFGKDFANKNIYVAYGYPEVVLKELEGDDLEHYAFFIPREGAVMFLDTLVILKTSDKYKEAHMFLNYLLRPDVHAFIADEFFYPTIIPAAEGLRKTTPPYTIATLKERHSELSKDVGPHLKLYADAWNQIFEN
jgi:spermidine/putrescine transport system substrate-binding protein